MKNIYIAAGLLFIGLFFCHYYCVRVQANAQADNVLLRKVAILIPVTHPSLTKITTAFQETLQKEVACRFDTYNAHGDRILLRSQAEKIVQEGYDLALVVGTQPSIIMKEVVTQRSKQLPLVCAAVHDPVQMGLVASLGSSGNMVTTVMEQQDYEYYRTQISLIKRLFPQVQRVLLVYSPTSMLDKAKELLVAVARENALQLSVLPVYVPYEIIQKAPALVSAQDCVIILKDNMVVSALEGLVAICNRFKVPLCASDLDSLAVGAACAYGVQEAQFGIEAAKKAYAILHDHQKPTNIASTALDMNMFRINQQALAALKIAHNKEFAQQVEEKEGRDVL